MIILEVVEYTYRREPLREFEVSRELRTRVPDDVPCTLKRRELIRDGCCIVFYCALQLARGQLRVGGFRGRKLERGIWVRGRELLMGDTRVEAGAYNAGAYERQETRRLDACEREQDREVRKCAHNMC